MWNYKSDAKLRDALANRDIMLLRSMVCGVLMEDPADSKGLAVEVLDYVRLAVPEVIEAHKERPLIELDKTKWNEECRDLMAGALVNNFSQKRFEHVVAVGQYVFSKHTECSHGVGSIHNKASERSNRTVLLGAAGVGLVVGLILLRKSTPFGAIITIVSVACGAYALMKGEKKA